MHVVRGALALFVLATLAWPSGARAGGFEVADHGAQAMGRGATFVAKADDPSAIHHNPAGLARQRGTRLFTSGNLFLHSYEFRRAGAFPDDPNDSETPWGGRPFPAVSNSGPAFVSPFAALATDFGYFDRFTLAVGIYGPSIIGNRTFPLGIDRAPSPNRYDFIQSRSILFFPTLSAGFRVTRWLDIGASAHVAVANFDQTQVDYTDLGECSNVEYQPCDTRSTLQATAATGAGTFGAILRPTANLAFGTSVRTPVGLEATGTLYPEQPRVGTARLERGAAWLYTDLPLVVRSGARYVSMDRDFEVYDLELDVVYEQWAAAQRDGPVLIVPNLGELTDIRSTSVHRYKDTFSIRGGGAYNFDAQGAVFSVRAGGFFDTPATEHAYTRLDFDTLAKVAGTLGFGYRTGAYAVDVAYAAIASIPRVVGTGAGDVRPINLGRNGLPVDANDQLLPAVNEGAYRGFTHVLSLGLSFTFDALFGPSRPIHYGNAYEPGYEADADDAVTEPEREREREPEPPPPPPPPPRAEPKPQKKVEPAPARTPPASSPPKSDGQPPSKKKKDWWEELDD